METKTLDWKDVANAQFDKAMTFSLLILLFAMLVTPRVDIQKQKFSVQQLQAVDLPPEEREKLKPPEDIVKPVVDIVISEELGGTDATDPALLEETLKQLGGDIYTTTVSNANNSGNENTFVFQEYEDAPEPVNPTPPAYPENIKKLGVEGMVFLEVDIYRDGTLGNIRVKKSLLPGKGGLDEAAIEAVKKWKFQPGKSGGKPVDTTVIIPVEFTLERN